MSEENVETVRQMWDAFMAGDAETALSIFAEDVEWDGSNLPDGRIAHGHEAVLDHIGRWADAWENWTVEVERVSAGEGDQVVLIFRERGRSSSGLTMDERHAEVYVVRNGKVVRRQGFSDPEHALEAAGLSE
jgi:ketosteroid isomerase-like protein